MPELPEVEILVRQLDPLLRGKQIRKVLVLRNRVVRPNSPDELTAALTGRRFERVERRAKFLLFHLSPDLSTDGRNLVVGHLGMTGRMFLQAGRRALPRHAAVALDLGSQRFVFEDTRYFGRFHLDAAALDGLGPEPLGEKFTIAAFTAALRRSSQPCKVKLLDQKVVAGVGNIYASEALFRAGISPRRPAKRLKSRQIARLREAVREVLQEAIQGGSTLPLDFGTGRDGLFYYGTSAREGRASHEEQLFVYNRTGMPCRNCGKAIRRIVQAARSTWYCPQCQHG